jgi:hypothetical protein
MFLESTSPSILPKKFFDDRGGGKIIFEKLLTIFGFVIWSSPRWHHCQAELISSESLKTSVARLNQAMQLRVRGEADF